LEVACRLCRLPLLHAGGCETCSHWKRNLVVTGDLPEENVDLGDLSGEALKMMRTQLRTLDKESRTQGLDTATRLQLGQQIRDFSRALAVIMGESRKVRKEGASAMRSMSFQEQAALFYEWTERLPPAHRQRVADTLMERLAAMAPAPAAALSPGTEEEDDDE
jgi:hypothetical protein